MKKEILCNGDIEVFPGFYNSELDIDNIIDIDTINDQLSVFYNHNYENEVGKFYINELSNSINTDEYKFIGNLKFEKIRSSKNYTHTTDKVEYSADVDFEKLKRWCMSQDNFKNYIYDHYSRSGFNGHPKKDDVLKHFNFDISILMDFFLLNTVDIPAVIEATVNYIENNLYDLCHSVLKGQDLTCLINNDDCLDANVVEKFNCGIIDRRPIEFYQESLNNIKDLKRYYTGKNKDDLLTHLEEVLEKITEDAFASAKKYELVYEGYYYDLRELFVK